ncbi:hypothetical protein [Streptomyces sp. NBC_01304]|uniref:hypothetical protein n=1 Tax=Streptomyces sp. NBC_01304 TaxID=2903818 RepID=UPI002E162E42|nr:hypothetical protein OG430_03160 [Streptomyces sp. NBC_01304]
MITGLCVLGGVLMGSFIVAWRARRIAARAEAGKAATLQVGANRPDAGRRYSLGRVRSDQEFRWEPRWSWSRQRELPAELRYVRTRKLTAGEVWRLPAGVMLIECESAEGPVRLWVREAYAAHVAEMIRRAGATDLPEPQTM